MKKIVPILASISLLVSPILCLAQEAPPGPIGGYAEIIAIVTRITNWIFGILMAVVVVMILWAAFEFLTAGGSPEKVGAARQKLTYAVIGIVVALLARSVVPIVKLILGIP